MRISRLGESVTESPTLRLNERARSLREQGEAVIHLGGGEPETPAPPGAVAACRERLDRGDIKYTSTAGIPPLRQLIAAYTEAQHGRPTAPSDVLVSAGAKPVLYAALVAVVNPGDEVMFPAPYWVSYPEMVSLVGGVPVAVSAGDGSHEPSVGDMEAAITPRTRAVILNSPNNPSGAVYRESFIEGVLALCRRHDLFLIADDIYRRLVFEGHPVPSAFRLAMASGDEERVIGIDGISKMFGMTGFRIGWAVGNPRVLDVMSNVLGQVLSCASALGQAAAVGALRDDLGAVDSLRTDLQKRAATAVSELGRIPGVRLESPRGTFYCLPDFRAYHEDSNALSTFLLEKARVVTVPGREFGREGHLRISYCGATEGVVEGIRRIRWALDPTAPAEITFGGRVHVRDWDVRNH